MLKYVFLLAFCATSSLVNASSIKELRSEEEGAYAAPLYMQYKQKNPIEENTFMDRWNRIRTDPNYSFLAVSEKDQMIGFLDFYTFPTLYHGNMIRIDSVFLLDERKEQDVFPEFFKEVCKKGKEKGAQYIIANTDAIYYPQEVRFFDAFMEKEEGKSVAYKFVIQE